MSKSIANNIRNVRAHLPACVTLVCVSKFQSEEAIREAYEAGERHFGESRVQELQRKVPVLPDDIRWHFIGHLQTNKVRDLLRLRPYLIESIDSERLLRTINDEAGKMDIVQDVLLEVHVAREESKTGFTPEELSAISHQLSALVHVRVCGLMCMATNTEDEEEIRRCFSQAAHIAHDLARQSIFSQAVPTLSMGMSDDYPLAIDCGSTSVRIGSAIFGEREHHPSPLTDHQCQKIRAVFFDQDGVLFNSMPFHAQSWELAMNEYGLPFTAEQTYRKEGRTGASVIAEAYRLVHGTDVPEGLCEQVYAAKSCHFNRLTGGRLPELIPGIQDVLHWLHAQGVQCWVVTGSGQRSLLDNLENTFPGIFTGFITAFDVTRGKPDPEPYLKAWERSGFRKDECMVVENAPLGVRSGKAAGLFVAAVNTGPLPDSDLAAEGADRIFPDMQALLQWLKH